MLLNCRLRQKRRQNHGGKTNTLFAPFFERPDKDEKDDLVQGGYYCLLTAAHFLSFSSLVRWFLTSVKHI